MKEWPQAGIKEMSRESRKRVDDHTHTMMTIMTATGVGNGERAQGFEMQSCLKPQVCFISIFLIYSTNFVLQYYYLLT